MSEAAPDLPSPRSPVVDRTTASEVVRPAGDVTSWHRIEHLLASNSGAADVPRTDDLEAPEPPEPPVPPAGWSVDADPTTGQPASDPSTEASQQAWRIVHDVPEDLFLRLRTEANEFTPAEMRELRIALNQGKSLTPRQVYMEEKLRSLSAAVAPYTKQIEDEDKKERSFLEKADAWLNNDYNYISILIAIFALAIVFHRRQTRSNSMR